jgi:hypothetical protein
MTLLFDVTGTVSDVLEYLAALPFLPGKLRARAEKSFPDG